MTGTGGRIGRNAHILQRLIKRTTVEYEALVSMTISTSELLSRVLMPF